MREINYTKHMTMKDAPVLRKTGAVAADGEFTPFVWKGRLYRLECHMIDREDGIELPCVIIVDVMERKECARFAYGLSYPSGYCEDDKIYVFGMKKRKLPEENDIAVMYCSEDMQTWAEYELFSRPGWRLWNTSVCKGPDGYRMAIEVSLDENIDEGRKKALQPVIGVPFTEFFMRSDDLLRWEWLDDDHCYTPERYCACPVLKYSDGYYYMICLEELPLRRYAPYIYRTKDFFTWEIGYHNPIMMPGNEDRKIRDGVEMDEATREWIESCFDINNSDVDMCEFEGKTYFYYGMGDQLSRGIICEAIYDGPLDEYLRRMFE